MSDYPTEGEDDNYEDDFEDEDPTSSRPTTHTSSSQALLNAPRSVKASAPPATLRDGEAGEDSFSSYHSSGDEGEDGGLDLLLRKNRSANNRDGSNENTLLGGVKLTYPTEGGRENPHGRPSLAAMEVSPERFEEEPAGKPRSNLSSSSKSSPAAAPAAAAAVAERKAGGSPLKLATASRSSYASTLSVSPVKKASVSPKSQPSSPQEAHHQQPTATQSPKNNTNGTRQKNMFAMEYERSVAASSPGSSSPVASASHRSSRSSAFQKARQHESSANTTHSQLLSTPTPRNASSSHASIVSPHEQQQQQQQQQQGGLVHQTNVTSVQVLEKEEDTSTYRGRSSRPVDDDDDDDDDAHSVQTASVGDGLPLPDPPHSPEKPPSTRGSPEAKGASSGGKSSSGAPPAASAAAASAASAATDVGNSNRQKPNVPLPPPDPPAGSGRPTATRPTSSSSAGSSSRTVSSSLSKASASGRVTRHISPVDTGIVYDPNKPPIMKTPTPRLSPQLPPIAANSSTSSAPAPWGADEHSSVDSLGRQSVRGTSRASKRSSPSSSVRREAGAPAALQSSSPLLSPEKVGKPRSNTATPTTQSTSKEDAKRAASRSRDSSRSHTRRSSTESRGGGGGGVRAANEKAALAARIEALKREVMRWHQRIQRKEEEVAELRKRYYGEEEDDDDNDGGEGNERGHRSGDAGRNGGSKRLPRTRMQQKLEQLREDNRELIRKKSKYKGQIINVGFLVARLDEQLIRFKDRLKEYQGIRRALDIRDKRAAHTIEEVHRRMPSREQLRDRQLNEGIYSQASLDRRVREVRLQLSKSKQSCELVLLRCEELEKEIARKKYCAISAKEYERLKQTNEANLKQIAKLKATVAVYMNAVHCAGLPMDNQRAQGERSSPGSQSQASNSTATTPQRRQRGRSTHSKSFMGHEDSPEAVLMYQQEAVAERRKILEEQIADLEAKLQLRSQQLQPNDARSRNAVSAASDSSSSQPVGRRANQGSRAADSTSAMLFGGDGAKKRSSLTGRPFTFPAQHTTAGAAAVVAAAPGSSGGERSAAGPRKDSDTFTAGGTRKRVVSSKEFNGTATLVCVDDEQGMSVRPANANDTDSDRFDFAKAKEAASASRAEDEEEAEDSVDDVLRAIDEDSKRLMSRAGGVVSHLSVEETRTPSNAVESNHAISDAGDGRGSEAAERTEDSPSTAFRSRNGQSDIEEEESVADAEEVGASGRTTPVWLR